MGELVNTQHCASDILANLDLPWTLGLLLAAAEDPPTLVKQCESDNEKALAREMKPPARFLLTNRDTSGTSFPR